MTQSSRPLSVAIIGAGPVGLAAAAHLLALGQHPFILEAGNEAGSAVRQWQHVRMFSPWRYNIDKVSAALLQQTGWQAPDETAIPTGRDLIETYLKPLSQTSALAPLIQYNTEVVAVTRYNFGKVKSSGRDKAPFLVRTRNKAGQSSDFMADAVIDASGTWRDHNPAGSSGIPATGELENAKHIAYGIPPILGQAAPRYAGKRILVVGAGHSAMNILQDLAQLRRNAPKTVILWAIRRAALETLYGGGAADQLPARGALGENARHLIDDGHVGLLAPFHIHSMTRDTGALRIDGQLRGEPHAITVDEVIVATGFRPNLDILREIRLGLDSWLESPTALAPLIDPNLHSCGTVRPHGYRELSHPETNFFIAGMKSYGRAPTFLLATGYEQVRSIAAHIAGEHAAADRVELDLPQTGVCSSRPAARIPTAATPTLIQDASSSCRSSGCRTKQPSESLTA